MLQIIQGIKIGSAILKCLKSAENRKDLIDTLMNVLGDGKCTKNILETANFLMSDDFLFHRKPEYSAISVFSRALYKVMPLSGGLRYLDRINDDWEKDLWTFN